MTTMSFDIFWRDHGASAGAKNLAKDVDKAHGATERLSKRGAALGTAFGAFIGLNVFGSFISQARESLAISRITEARIRSTGGAAHITAAQVGELATSISNKTGADDEAVQSGENMLLTFTNVRNEVGRGNDIFNQASMAAVDMAAALNGGKVTAEGTSQASILLGKALNDPIKGLTALRRVGVAFTAQQEAQIKTLVKSGDVLGAQKIILGELSKEFGGTAKAAADPMQRLSVIAGNLEEQVGTALMPVFDRFASFMADTGAPAISSFVTVLTKIPGPVYAAGAGLVALGLGIMGVSKAIGIAKDVSAATGVIMRTLGIRVGGAPVALEAEAVAAGTSATATTAAGTAAGGAAGKFVLLKGAVLGVAAVAGTLAAWNWASDALTAKTSTDKLAASLANVNDQGKNLELRRLFQSPGILGGPFQRDSADAAEALRGFDVAATKAFGQGWLERTHRVLTFGAASRQAEEQIRALDGGIANLVKSGNMAGAQEAFHTLQVRLPEIGVHERRDHQDVPGIRGGIAAGDRRDDRTPAGDIRARRARPRRRHRNANRRVGDA